jgi:hypothetical protein
VHAVAELAVEAVGVEQREEELVVLFLAVVRGGGHQQEVAGVGADLLGEAEAGGGLDLGAEVVGGELVGLVADDEVPAGLAELVLEVAGSSRRAIWSRRTMSWGCPRRGCPTGRPARAGSRRCGTRGRTSRGARRAIVRRGCRGRRRGCGGRRRGAAARGCRGRP